MGCIKSTVCRSFKYAGEPATNDVDVLEQFYKVDTKVLGAGSYAKVYRAVEIKTGQVVAVKRIDKEHSRRELLDSEITILRRFGNHRHIVRLFACFETAAEVQLVMEFLPGGELFDVLDQNGPYGEGDAARHIKAVASGLDYLHKNFVVHRDLKPENLLLTARPPAVGTLKISDFGLARMLKEGEVLGKAAGTWAYCAPEVLKIRKNGSGAYGIMCDMFSLGVLTFVILAGYHPFDLDGDRTEKHMQEAIISGTWDFKDPAWDSVSEEAKDLIELLLEGEPTQRLSAKAALAHPWTSGVSPYGSLSGSINADLAAYRLRMRQKQLKAGLIATQSVFRLQGLQQGQTKSQASRRWDLVRSAWRRGEFVKLAPNQMHKVVRIAHHRWLRAQHTPDLGEDSRRDMIVRLFRALDLDRDGYLDEREMFRFAKFKDFPGEHAEWNVEYINLCSDCGWAVDLGVDFLSFELLLNTKECSFYSDDAFLEQRVNSLTGYKQPGQTDSLRSEKDSLSSSMNERSSLPLSARDTRDSTSTKKKKAPANGKPRATKKSQAANGMRLTQSQHLTLDMRESLFQNAFHSSKSQPLDRNSPRPCNGAKKAKSRPSTKPKAKPIIRLGAESESTARLVDNADVYDDLARNFSSEKIKPNISPSAKLKKQSQAF